MNMMERNTAMNIPISISMSTNMSIRTMALQAIMSIRKIMDLTIMTIRIISLKRISTSMDEERR